MQRLEQIIMLHPAGIILREKDLTENQYKELAEQVVQLCKKHGVTCILHSFVQVAMKLQTEAIHLPLSALREMTDEQKAQFSLIGASCHSVEDALEAERLGCTYITVGHIFVTDCKKGLPGRGIDFLLRVCESVDIPVYAIGGIHKDNVRSVIEAGAKGACFMSGLMQCKDAEAYLKNLEKAGEVDAI